MASLKLKVSKRLGGFNAYSIGSKTKDGKQIQFVIENLGHFQTRRDAEREFSRNKDRYTKEEIRQTHKAIEANKKAPILSEAIPHYISMWKHSENGLRSAKLSLKNLEVRLGKIKLTDIIPSEVHRYVALRRSDFTNRPDGPDGRVSINLEINTLSALMGWAIDQGIIEYHPFRNEANPLSKYHFKINEKVPTILTDKEILIFLNAFKDKPHNYSVFLGYLLTGMRKEELMQLRWDMVDLPAGLIRFTTPKTGKIRIIQLQPILQSLLTKMQTEWPDCHHWLPRKPEQMVFVFCTSQGNPFTWNIGLFLPRQAKALGLRHIHLHDLRHTFATRLAEVAPGPIVQQALGHTSYKTTQRYVSLGATESAQKSFAKMFNFLEIEGQSAETRNQKRNREIISEPTLAKLPEYMELGTGIGPATYCLRNINFLSAYLHKLPTKTTNIRVVDGKVIWG
jgi:integrase